MKFETFDAAKEHLAGVKEELKIAKGELKNARKEMGLKGDEAPSKEKDQKKLKKLTDLITKKEADIEATREWMSNNKPKKEKTARPLKYDYPEGADADMKKKIRQKARAAAKAEEKAKLKAEQGETPSKKEKKADKNEKAEKPEKAEKKKDKKKDKKAAASQKWGEEKTAPR